MQLFTLFLGLSALASTITGHAIADSTHDYSPALEKRAFLPVVGAPGATVPRFEIRQLQQKTNQWTLYLLAMKQMKAKTQTTKNSYYQIAGIHGVPFASWDDVGKCSTCSGGYCTHSSILFLGWHRAYMALMEQELVKVAKSIAAKYPASTKAAMQSAAASLRLPYWDWAAHPPNGGNNMPAALTASTVTVQGPSGQQTFVNPLHHHTFTSSSALVYSPYTSWKNTLRYPTSTANTATSNQAKAIAALNNIRSSLQDQVYNMFSTCDEFIEVGADEAGTSSTKCSNSIENIHNLIHNAVGGPKNPAYGHMTILALAAFDPAFWVHHANVDRLFAMWQAINPNSYSGSQAAPSNTWTIAKGSTQNLNSPLTPFHKNAAGDFWTTTQVRNHKIFHYTYPEFADSDGSKAAIVSYVNKLYGPNAQATAGSSKREAAPQDDSPAAATTTTPTSSSSTSSASPTHTVDSTPLRANNGSLFQYTANIQTSRYALGGSYNIFLFNGAPSTEDASQWMLDPNLIGPMGVLAMPGMTGSDLIITGSVPLTRTLTEQVAAGKLLDLTQALAVPYLVSNLVWRVSGPTGEEIDPTTIPDFEISVWASTATDPGVDALPVWSTFIPLAEITKNKAGGATPATIKLPPLAKGLGKKLKAAGGVVGKVVNRVA